jgi:hypothetical protein
MMTFCIAFYESYLFTLVSIFDISIYCYFTVALSAVVTPVRAGEYKVTNSSIILVLSNMYFIQTQAKVRTCTKFSHKFYTQCPGVVHYTVMSTYSALHRQKFVFIVGKHWVGRVLRFFSSRRNWDSPNPSPAGECDPLPVLGGGARSLAREGLGESQFLRGYIHCGTLYTYTYTYFMVERLHGKPSRAIKQLGILVMFIYKTSDVCAF